jgi:phosphatidylcholine synthase
VSAIAVAVFALLTFAPIDFVHPVRVRAHRPWLAGLTAIWGIGSFALLVADWSAPWTRLWLIVSLIGAGGLLAVGGLRTWRGPSR